MGGFLASEFEDAVSVRDQTAGGHRAKGEERKKTANTKCQQIEEYHPVCLSHCGVMWRGSGWERGGRAVLEERIFQGLHRLTGGAAVNKGGGIKKMVVEGEKAAFLQRRRTS